MTRWVRGAVPLAGLAAGALALAGCGEAGVTPARAAEAAVVLEDVEPRMAPDPLAEWNRMRRVMRQRIQEDLTAAVRARPAAEWLDLTVVGLD